MRTTDEPEAYRVSYRLVVDRVPNTSMIVTCVIEAPNTVIAESQAYEFMTNYVVDLLGTYDIEWLRRTTVTKLT